MRSFLPAELNLPSLCRSFFHAVSARRIGNEGKGGFYGIFGETGYNGLVPLSAENWKKWVFSDTIGPFSISASIKMVNEGVLCLDNTLENWYKIYKLSNLGN